ncbi:primosomal protein [Saccharothrix yanglingensis]|uniref:Primosomal protein n=1 Tax=Saccharothrix yanglingensis TaxID=659496 RepID=A0ABU0X4Z6_9PSEU|nr:primosomal protein [Saccharothrix yanglingensis]MDQ2587216.1 primosomal protein [Saccharothrix yanglingensis]
MAQDIVPIELGLTQGDVVTLWAPRWREEGEEWEAFLGHEEDLYVFPDAAHLAAFVRTAEEHDLVDHPAWHVVPALTVGELSPDDNHQFDLVGVPELVAEEPDTWVIGELADVISIVRSLADVCDLEKVHEILDSAEGFSLLPQGTLPFTGREGQALWTEIAQVVSDKWDEVLDAIDEVVTTPDVDETTLRTTREELAAFEEANAAAVGSDEDDEDSDEEPVGFWGEVGIDPIKIITGAGEYYTLRCYLDDQPVFLGRKGKIDVFGSPRALARFIVEADDNDMNEVSTWGELVTKATGGDLDVEVDPDNVYVLTGLDEDIADGPDAVDPTQLDLVVELLEDAGEWAHDDTVKVALNGSERLGWLVNYVLKPDPTRLAPSAPFDDEVTAWRTLVAQFEDRLKVH